MGDVGLFDEPLDGDLRVSWVGLVEQRHAGAAPGQAVRRILVVIQPGELHEQTPRGVQQRPAGLGSQVPELLLVDAV